MGRATIRTDEMVDQIVRRLANGEFLTVICRDEGMPERTTFYDWMLADETLSQRVARAREMGQDVLFEETVEIADDGSADYKMSGRDGAEITIDSEHIQRSKLRIWTRLEVLKKLNPKKYGDRQQFAPTDTEGNPAQFAPIMFVGVEAKEESE